MTEKEQTLIYMCIVGGILVLYFILYFTAYVTKSPWFCKYFGWHDGKGKPPKKKKSKYPDINTHATCSRCGKEVMQDSQGNWF